MTTLLFYLACFWLSFFLCMPIGPVNLAVFHNAVKKQHHQALSIAFGAATGDAIWAVAAFYGISPFLKNGYNLNLEGIFLLITAIITFILALIAIKDANLIVKIEKKEQELVQKIKRKRWAILKGLTMVLVNPLGLASWMIGLSFLRKLKIYIPLRPTFKIFFFITVVLGAFAYFTTIVIITHRMKDLFDPKRTGKIIKCLGYVLFAFSLYFLFFALKALLAR